MTALKLTKTFFLSCGFAFTLSSAALADQCAYVTKPQALAAVSYLNLGQTIYQFCQPCGDASRQAIQIHSVSAGTVGYGRYWGVKVNDADIDLAYIYIDSRKRDRKVNLAALAKCPTRGVSRYLQNN